MIRPVMGLVILPSAQDDLYHKATNSYLTFGKQITRRVKARPECRDSHFLGRTLISTGCRPSAATYPCKRDIGGKQSCP